MPEVLMDDDVRHDPAVAALQRSVVALNADPAAAPDPTFRQRARTELMQALAVPPPAGGWAGLIGQVEVWRLLAGRRRLVGLGVGAALFSLVAVPALAAPSLVAGVVSGAVDTFVGVPSLLTGTYQPIAHPIFADRDDRHSAVTTESVTGAATASTSSTSTSSLSTTSSSATTHPANHGAIVSNVARSATEQGEAHGDAVSAAAHKTASSSTSTSTSTTTTTTTTTTTSAAETGNHGAVVSAVAHETPPPGENHGQQVSSVARGIATASTSSSATAGIVGHGHNGHGGGAPPTTGTSHDTGNGANADQGANGKGHGR